MSTVALSELLGVPVLEPGGRVRGRVREIAMCPQEDPIRISGVIVRTQRNVDSAGTRFLSMILPPISSK